MDSFLAFVHHLLEPIPQYVLGCLPALATIGAAPMENFLHKLIWVAICLGCPFTGLFYTCIIPNDELPIFWLPKIWHHSASMLRLEEECTANASVLERLSSLASLYYISIGIIAGISRALGPSFCEDWPYIPMALSWTLPAIFRRIVHGKLLVRDPRKKLGNRRKIFVRKFEHEEYKVFIHTQVVITALASTTVPWLTVLLAYYTPPIGYFCRSIYLTVICSIWSFNNIVGYIHHWLEEKNKIADQIIAVWFFICGVMIAILLFFLVLLSKQPSWWVNLFGNACASCNSM
ncbi:6777_t:CDS:2 [Ambispora leptoticha]|uniref:6777_t:CDS:1 n=1 Tax=Ambispora leptoticha TaxID=144679 RepID=A0A9N9CJQ3_9GLOM|nr:6777_t:CDS:2 [Ambispora leptoticha]